MNQCHKMAQYNVIDYGHTGRNGLNDVAGCCWGREGPGPPWCAGAQGNTNLCIQKGNYRGVEGDGGQSEALRETGRV